jgi:hypothetical protein
MNEYVKRFLMKRISFRTLLLRIITTCMVLISMVLILGCTSKIATKKQKDVLASPGSESTFATVMPLKPKISPTSIILVETFTPQTSSFQNTSEVCFTSTPLPTNISSYPELDPETWVKVMPAVREYLYFRKKSIIAGNVEILWKQYPELKQGVDFSKGINSEEHTISNFQVLKPFDGNVTPEFYEKIKVILSDEHAQVLIHGWELYLYHDEAGKFDDTGGELKMVLFLRNEGNRWTVYKTIDVSGP